MKISQSNIQQQSFGMAVRPDKSVLYEMGKYSPKTQCKLEDILDRIHDISTSSNCDIYCSVEGRKFKAQPKTAGLLGLPREINLRGLLIFSKKFLANLENDTRHLSSKQSWTDILKNPFKETPPISVYKMKGKKWDYGK